MDYFAPQEQNYAYLDRTELRELYEDLARLEALIHDDPYNTNLRHNRANLETAINYTLSLHSKFTPTTGEPSEIKKAVAEKKVVENHRTVVDTAGIAKACKALLHDMDTVMQLEQETENLSQDRWEQLHVGAGPFLRRVLERTPFDEIKK